jgi:hypothetical protein
MGRWTPAAKGKRDATHTAIQQALEQAGCVCVDLSNVGGGCPDILATWTHREIQRDGDASLVTSWSRTELFEVKTAKGLTRPAQVKFRGKWPGTIHEVRTVDEALKIVRGE